MIPDRSIPFCNVIMKREAAPVPPPQLPRGYTLRLYREGDETDWARLEHEIGDFDSVEEAEAYFRTAYLHAEIDIRERGVFAADAEGKIVGSCIAWKDDRCGASVASLHWLVVSPAHQGLGLGKALCRKVLQLFDGFGEAPVYLHTQPWSHRAIVLYVRNGFRLQKSDTFSHYQNQHKEAMRTLERVLPPQLFRELSEHTDA